MQSIRQHMIMERPLYQKLKEEDSIRLLILEPGNRNSPISCRLVEARLSAKPRYKAVSYTWGEPVLSHSICINGRPMGVRDNLFTALLYLRHTSRTQTLWIDALSINQDDISERNQQVRIMGQIYKNSHLTAVWLREEKESDTPALNLLRLCSVLAKDNNLTEEAQCLRISGSIFGDNPANTENILSSLCGILTSDWFGRLWIVQEFGLSSHVRMRCGDKEFLPEGLKLLEHVWHTSPRRFQLGYGQLHSAITKISPLLHMRDTIQVSTGLDLGALLFMTVGRFKATELLDSVFALLSLIRTGHSTLRPDYDLTAAQVFCEAARISLECGWLFDILCLSCLDPDSALKRSLPSWVPDFSDPERPYLRLQASHDVYSAGGNKTPTISFTEDGLVLKLKGKILDTMSILLSSLPGLGASWNLLQEWYNERKRLAHEYGDCPATEQFPNYWWRLAICDVHTSTLHEESRASLGFGSFYLDQRITEPFSSDNMEPKSLLQEEPLRIKQREYLHSLFRYAVRMAFCRTEKRYLGWATPYAQSGDKICLFEGAAAPWVIRPKSDGTFQLIGEAYIHGIMYGEAMEWEGTQWENIQLS